MKTRKSKVIKTIDASNNVKITPKVKLTPEQEELMKKELEEARHRLKTKLLDSNNDIHD